MVTSKRLKKFLLNLLWNYWVPEWLKERYHHLLMDFHDFFFKCFT